MSQDPRVDPRPRIHDLSAPVSGFRFGAYQDLAWPCDAYRVTVPVRTPSPLNLFEETTLRILGVTRADVEGLDKATRLPRDLVRLVLLRLRDAGYIDDDNELTAQGKVLLESLDVAPVEPELRVVFRELIEGHILPVVFGGALEQEELVGVEGSWVAIRTGRGRGERILKLRRLKPSPGTIWSPPRSRDVLRTIERHRRLSQKYMQLRSAGAPCPPPGRDASVEVDASAERVYLRCRMFVPVGTTEFRISDPFGYGCSELLERTYRGLLSRSEAEDRFVRKMKERGLAVRVQSPSDQADDSDSAKEAVLRRFGSAIQGYPGVARCLERAHERFNESRRPSRSSDEEARIIRVRQELAEALYESLEQALCLVVAGAPAPVVEKVLRRGRYEQNQALLQERAEQLGLELRGAGNLLSVAGGRVRGVREGAVDLQALIALAVLAATEDPMHPFRQIVQDMPDWLPFVYTLKRHRDSSAHGADIKAGHERMTHLLERTYKSLPLLLPTLKGDDGDTAAGRDASTSAGAHSDERLEMRTQLEAVFSVHGFGALSNDVQQQLFFVEAESRSVHPDGEASREVHRPIKALASIVQHLIHGHVSRYLRDGARRQGKETTVARRRAVAAGFEGVDERLPRSLSTVAKRRVRQALRGLSPSLGACTVALFVVADEAWLSELAAAAPDLIGRIHQLLELRGHGNEPICMLPAEYLTLRDEIYRTCKTLMEA